MYQPLGCLHRPSFLSYSLPLLCFRCRFSDKTYSIMNKGSFLSAHLSLLQQKTLSCQTHSLHTPTLQPPFTYMCISHMNSEQMAARWYVFESRVWAIVHISQAINGEGKKWPRSPLAFCSDYIVMYSGNPAALLW